MLVKKIKKKNLNQ